jgi:thiomorpholine-carboxylate dehydrogenase
MITIEEDKRYSGHHARGGGAAMGLKLVSFYPGNAGTAVPTHLAMILLFRTDTGEPLAVMDGRLITEMRTAAVSAAVTRHLAAPDSRVLALIGSGLQAEAHLEALSRVRRFDEVRVWSRTPAHAEAASPARTNVRAMDVESAARGAMVVTATNAREPIVKGAWPQARGSRQRGRDPPRPTWRELDDDAMASVLVVDSREAVLTGRGCDSLQEPDLCGGGEISTARSRPRLETTVFKSVGLAGGHRHRAAGLRGDAAARLSGQRMHTRR